MKQFSTFLPFYGNKNPFVRFFVTLENGIKKELKHLKDNTYYYCTNRQRNFVEITGSLYNKQFKEI